MIKLSVVTKSKTITINGEAITADFIFPANLLTMDWSGLDGHAKWADGPNTGLTTEFIKPYVDIWQAAKDAVAVVSEAPVAPTLAPPVAPTLATPVVTIEPLEVVHVEPEVEVVIVEPAPIPQELFEAAYRKYLADTDWYIVRAVEAGMDVPASVTAARKAARAVITK